MWPDRVSNPGPLTYESGVLPIAPHGPVCVKFHENMSSGFKIIKRTRKLLTHKGQ